jgi:uncharacterized protein (DUF2267 family)
MKTAIQQTLTTAEDRYLSDQELYPFRQCVATYAARYNAYRVLRAEAHTLVLNALRQLMRTQHRNTVKDHGAKCQRDMLYTLECVAKAMLLDDPGSFMEDYVRWMENITRALHKEESAIAAYRALQQVIRGTMAVDSANLVNSYLDRLIEAMVIGNRG